MKKYGNGSVEDTERCVAGVFDYPYLHDGSHQCSRKRGFGKDGSLCKQHAKAMESEKGFVYIPKEAPDA